MKRKYIASLLCVCLLLCNLSMIQGKRAQAGKVHLTSKAVTIIKGQYAFIGLKGTNTNVKWREAGGKIKIHETNKNSGKTCKYCYIKAVHTGTGTLKCIVNNRILKCKVNVLSKSAFIGDFSDDAGEVYLDIFKSGKKYVAFYSQFRLAKLDWLEGTVKNGILTLNGRDSADNPVTVTLSCKDNKRIFTFKKTTWEYFTQGSTIELKKCKGKEGYEKALHGFGLYYNSYI